MSVRRLKGKVARSGHHGEHHRGPAALSLRTAPALAEIMATMQDAARIDLLDEQNEIVGSGLESMRIDRRPRHTTRAVSFFTPSLDTRVLQPISALERAGFVMP